MLVDRSAAEAMDGISTAVSGLVSLKRGSKRPAESDLSLEASEPKQRNRMIASTVDLSSSGKSHAAEQLMWKQRGWDLVQGALVDLAARWLDLVKRIEQSRSKGTGPAGATSAIIQGDIKQMAFRGLNEPFASEVKLLRKELKKAVQDRLRELGLDRSQLNFLKHLVDTKVMISRQGQGQQSIHRDSAEPHLQLPLLHERISIVLYLVDTVSTDLPTYSQTEQLASDNGDAAAQQAFCERYSLQNYASQPVVAGTLLLFKQTVAHRGIANPHAHRRIVLFDMLSDSTQIDQDDYTTPDWLEVRRAYGDWSEQFLASYAAAAAAGLEPQQHIHGWDTHNQQRLALLLASR
jgi:hypothetical protein